MKRTTGAAIVLWCVTVAAAVGVGWGAIELVGDDVGPGPSLAAPTSAAVTTPAATATPTTKPSPSRTARPTPTPTASRSAAPAPTSRTTTVAPPPVSTVKTWTGAAGSVRVSCTSGVIKLLGATPADGWRVERAESGSDVDVRFERGEDEVEVEARCGSAGPVFTVETKD